MKKNLLLSFFALASFFHGRMSAQWQQTNGPIIANITAFAATSSSLFATTTTGIYKSGNNGATWSAVNGGISSNCMAASGSTIVTTSSYFYPNDVSISTNNGLSWTTNMSPTGLPLFATINALAINSNSIFAAINGGVFVSVDNAVSWTSASSGITPGTSVTCLAVVGNTLLAGTAGAGVYVSIFNGFGWAQSNTGLSNTLTVNAVLYDTNAGMFYAGTNNGVFSIAVSGTSWTPSTGIPANTSVKALAVNGSDLFAGCTTGMYLSTTSGSSWTPVNNGLMNLDVRALYAYNSGILAGTYGNGAFSTVNNGSLWTANGSLGTNPNASMAALAASNGTLFAATAFNGIFSTTDDGATWNLLNLGLTTPYIKTLLVNGSNLFAGTYDGGVFLSANNGASWSAVNNGLTDLKVYAMAAIGNTIFAGTWFGSTGVFVSTNNGTSWSAANTGLTNMNVFSMAADGNNLYAGTQGGGVFLSANNGASWTPVNNGLPSSSITVNALTANGGTVYAATSDGVYVTVDNGGVWTAINTGLSNPNTPVLPAYALLAGPSGVYAAANTFGYGGGVFFSGSNANYWTLENEGFFMAADVKAFAISGQYVYAGTWFNSVWRRPLSQLTAIHEQHKNSSLVIYPNPVSDKLNISGNGAFDLEVTNALGQPVLLQSSNDSSSLMLDVSSLSTGVYMLNRYEKGRLSGSEKFIKQ